ncbi:MAG: hypothetical protein WEA54_03515 [Actinomycetota bacterium]
MNARKQRLLEKVGDALPRFLEPGERSELVLQAVTGANPWLITAIVTVVGIAVVVPLGISGVLGSFWLYVVLGAVVGAATGFALVATSSWIVLTDRRLLLVKMSGINQAPTDLREALPRTAVTAEASPRSGGLGYRDVSVRRADGVVLVLRANRLWHEEAQQLAGALGAPAPPPPAPSSP